MGAEIRKLGTLDSRVWCPVRRGPREAVGEFYQSLLDGLPEAVVVVGEDGRISFVNRRSEELFGYARQELLRGSIERLTPEEAWLLPTAKDDRSAGLRLSIPPGASKVLSGRHKDGSRFPVEIRCRAVEAAGQSFVACVLREPASRKQRDEAPGEKNVRPRDPRRTARDDDDDDREIVGRSPTVQDLLRLVRLVAESHATVLVQGESGTGKELVARAIHRHSQRCERPFVAVNCAALPEALLESELFGHVKGAFTGAVCNKKGLFEEADGGTLLLDEITEAGLAIQAKLLRVLEQKEIRPVGGNKSIAVDVRVIATTNRSLKQAVAEKVFRADLAYRLGAIPLFIAPLRQRPEDIPQLAVHFVERYCRENGLPAKRIPPDALRLLVDYPWPGNVRELEHLIERAVLLSPGPEIIPRAFLLPQQEDSGVESLGQAIASAVAVVERDKILQAIRQAGGNRSRAAHLLHISRATLYKKVKRYHLGGVTG